MITTYLCINCGWQLMHCTCSLWEILWISILKYEWLALGTYPFMFIGVNSLYLVLYHMNSHVPVAPWHKSPYDHTHLHIFIVCEKVVCLCKNNNFITHALTSLSCQYNKYRTCKYYVDLYSHQVKTILKHFHDSSMFENWLVLVTLFEAKWCMA